MERWNGEGMLDSWMDGLCGRLPDCEQQETEQTKRIFSVSGSDFDPSQVAPGLDDAATWRGGAARRFLSHQQTLGWAARAVKRGDFPFPSFLIGKRPGRFHPGLCFFCANHQVNFGRPGEICQVFTLPAVVQKYGIFQSAPSVNQRSGPERPFLIHRERIVYPFPDAKEIDLPLPLLSLPGRVIQRSVAMSASSVAQANSRFSLS
jgi:hypothetical protein